MRYAAGHPADGRKARPHVDLRRHPLQQLPHIVAQFACVFAGAPSPLVAGRYHSLVVLEDSLPDVFEVSATSNNLIMGMRHRALPVFGVQFHPESIVTEHGHQLLGNFLAIARGSNAPARAA